MSNILDSMSAAAKRDLDATIERWTSADLDVKKAIRAEGAAGTSHKERGFARTLGAAYATDAAYQRDMIGKGKVYEGTQEWADALGLASKGNVTRLKALGRALRIAGLDPKGDVYVTLQTKSATAWDEVKEVQKADTYTESDLADAIAKHVAAQEKRAKVARKTADEKAAEEKAKVEKEIKAALDAMLPQDRLDWIMAEVKVLLNDTRTQPKHVNALERRMASAIGGHRAKVDAATAEAQVAQSA